MRLNTCLPTALILLGTLPTAAAHAQYGQQGYNNNGYYHRNGGGFDRGLRDSGRGGDYYDRRHENDGYNQRNDQYYRYGDQRYDHRGGIGPGKGALIGGGGGAVVGALLGGGMKGALIGGAAGAGVGAIAGKVHQDHRRDEY